MHGARVSPLDARQQLFFGYCADRTIADVVVAIYSHQLAPSSFRIGTAAAAAAAASLVLNARGAFKTTGRQIAC